MASTDDHVEIIHRDTPYRGFFRIDRLKLRHRLFSGGMSPVLNRELFERGHAAALLPYDPEADEVVLIEQFRVGAFGAGRHPWLREIVAGIVEPGESPEDVVRRECKEEIGCGIGELVPIAEFLPSPGALTEVVTLFCGRADATARAGVFGNADEGEDIRAYRQDYASFKADIRAGRADNSITLIAGQWLVMNHDDLRRRWGVAGAGAIL